MFTYWEPSDYPDAEELRLRTEALRRYGPECCATWWGSHGCDKPYGHVQAGDIVHQCGTNTDDPDDSNYNGGPCTQCITLGPETDDFYNAAVRHYHGDGEWGPWGVGGWFS